MIGEIIERIPELGAADGAHLRRGRLDRRDAGGDRAPDRGASGPRHLAVRADRQGKGRRGAARLRARAKHERADDPRRRPDRRSRRTCRSSIAPLAEGRPTSPTARGSSTTSSRRDAVPQRAREQVLLGRVQRSAATAGQGHALRNQGAAQVATTRRSRGHARYFGDFDPFGDFDLLLGAGRLNLKIVDVPVRYHARTLRNDEHQPLPPRSAPAADGGLRILEVPRRAVPAREAALGRTSLEDDEHRSVRPELAEVEGRDHARRAGVGGVAEECRDPEELLGRLQQRVVVERRPGQRAGRVEGLTTISGTRFDAESSSSSQVRKTTVLPAR